MRKLGPIPYLLTFFLCFLTWIILSGKFDLFHLSLGVISSAVVSALSADLVFSTPALQHFHIYTFRFFMYLPWLFFQVFLANIHVMYLVFHPRMMELIDPKIIRFESRMEGEMAHLIFANSITLTPGTITVYVSILGNYTVHAIDRPSAAGLPGMMEKRVAGIFKI